MVSIFYADAGPLVGSRLLLPGLSQVVRSDALFSALVRPWKSSQSLSLYAEAAWGAGTHI